MKISDIAIYPVEVAMKPLAEGGIAPYWVSQSKTGMTTASSVIVKVTTDEGIVGWGETNLLFTPKITQVIMEDYIKPKVIGKSPFDLKWMMEEFSLHKNSRKLNTRSFLTGVEIACWDIMGKAVQKPVYELLGGKIRDKIEVAYCLGILSIEETVEKIHQVKEAGYRTLKTKGGRDVVFDIERAKAIREAAGPEFEFRVDINMGYDTPQALRYLKGVEECDLQYIEQPIKLNKLDDLKMLRQRTKTPIGINEDCYVPNNLFEAVKKGCIDFAIVDSEQIGGITELIRMASIAEEADLPLVQHNGFDMGVKMAANLHVTCSMPAFTYAMDSTYQDFADDVLTEALQVVDGCFPIPDGPGLGIEVDEEKLKKLAIG